MYVLNMFFYCYFWVFLVFICLLVVECFEYLDNIFWKKILGVNLILVSGFIIMFLFKKYYYYFNFELFFLILIFFLVYIILIISFVSK